MAEESILLKNDEKVIFRLRSLFRRFGYVHCKVNRFEEYNFYARNRSFLPGEDILTFTDNSGRLMALKPDITMSIVKNARDRGEGLEKLCYNENVYRTAPGSNGFREIVQTGLECIGDVDDYAMGEVVMLACSSLETISPSYILSVSHIGVLSGLLDRALPENADRTPFLRAMEQKSLPALTKCCTAAGISKTDAAALASLNQLYGTLAQVLPTVEALSSGEKMENACRELQDLARLMEAYGLGDRVYLDFSVISSADYYSGLLLRGYVDGIPAPVLQGGQYDRLVQRMGKNAGAIGFAVYLDQLERFHPEASVYDTDILLLYGDDVPAEQVIQTIQMLSANGSTVRAEKTIPPGVRFRQLLGIQNGGVVILGNDD